MLNCDNCGGDWLGDGVLCGRCAAQFNYRYRGTGSALTPAGAPDDYEDESHMYTLTLEQIAARDAADAEYAAMSNQKIVTIPACTQHEGFHRVTVKIDWICPVCGGPRGEVFQTLSYDGSRRLSVDGWTNPCGHVDTYADVRAEAERVAMAEPEHWEALTCAKCGDTGEVECVDWVNYGSTVVSMSSSEYCECAAGDALAAKKESEYEAMQADRQARIAERLNAARKDAA